MERSSKRGKIPQQDWPSIIKRYEAGETLASIARTYDCSPPAISYILSRSRARDATVDGTEQSGIESAGTATGKRAAERYAGQRIYKWSAGNRGSGCAPSHGAGLRYDGWHDSRPGIRRTGFRVEWDGGSVGNRSGNRRDGNSGPSSQPKSSRLMPLSQGPGIPQGRPGQPVRSPNLRSLAARFTSRCRTTMLNQWKPRSMTGASPIWPTLRRFGPGGANNKG